MKDEESSKIIEEANLQLERGKNKNAFLGWKGLHATMFLGEVHWLFQCVLYRQN